MPTLMQNAATWLGAQLQAAAGRSIIYHRSSDVSGTISGVCSKVEYEVLDRDEGAMTAVTFDDWLFTASELIVNGTAITPRIGDQITETLNGTTITYEVLPIDKRPCFEFADSSGILLTVHTKRVG
jgi:hypothetical protein